MDFDVQDAEGKVTAVIGLIRKHQYWPPGEVPLVRCLHAAVAPVVAPGVIAD